MGKQPTHQKVLKVSAEEKNWRGRELRIVTTFDKMVREDVPKKVRPERRPQEESMTHRASWEKSGPGRENDDAKTPGQEQG